MNFKLNIAFIFYTIIYVSKQFQPNQAQRQ